MTNMPDLEICTTTILFYKHLYFGAALLQMKRSTTAPESHFYSVLAVPPQGSFSEINSAQGEMSVDDFSPH